MPSRLSAVLSRRSSCLVALAVLAGATLAGSGCGSKNGGGSHDAGNLFGGGDSGGTSGGSTGSRHSTSGHSGSTGSKGTGGSSSMSNLHGPCTADGGRPPSDWCNTNAPMGTSQSGVLCEDFDSALPLDGSYGYSGISRSDWVGGDFVSPYCALRAFVGGDAGGTTTLGSYSYHVYTYVNRTGVLSMAADLNIPNRSECEGATVMRIFASPDFDPSNAVMAWLKVSGIKGSGAIASGYTLELYAQGGTKPDGGGTVAAPVTFNVTPGSMGWARVGFAALAYSIPQPPISSMAEGSIDAIAYWTQAGDVMTMTKNASPPVNASGQLGFGSNTPGGEMDVGIIPDPTSCKTPGDPGCKATSGCEVLVDNAVSNL